MQITTYLFDLDDTLIGTKIYKELYKPILSKIKQKLKLSAKQLDQKAKHLGLKKNKFNRWDTGNLCKELDMLDEYYEILTAKIKVMPVLNKKVIKTFKRIKAKDMKLGIVSNSRTRTIKTYMNLYKLTKYIDFIFSAENAGCKKSDKAYWQALIKQHKLNPKDCLVIGDDLEDDKQIPETLGFSAFLIKKPEDMLKTVKFAV